MMKGLDVGVWRRFQRIGVYFTQDLTKLYSDYRSPLSSHLELVNLCTISHNLLSHDPILGPKILRTQIENSFKIGFYIKFIRSKDLPCPCLYI